MDISNDILLAAFAVILLALLMMKPSRSADNSPSEIKWIRRKMDLLHLQTLYMLKNSGVLSVPSKNVLERLDSKDESRAIQVLREETGLGAKDAKRVIDTYLANSSNPATRNADNRSVASQGSAGSSGKFDAIDSRLANVHSTVNDTARIIVAHLRKLEGMIDEANHQAPAISLQTNPHPGKRGFVARSRPQWRGAR